MDSGGISDDETDTEGSIPPNLAAGGPKVVRRVQLIWLARDFAKLWRAVDQRYTEPLVHASHGLRVASQRGNTPLLRVWEAVNFNHTRPPVPKLPKNWYDPEWWSAQPEAVQRSLQPQDSQPIPTLVSLLFPIGNSSTDKE